MNEIISLRESTNKASDEKRVTVSENIIERLRSIAQDMRHDARLDDDARTLRAAADEIEKLHKLIAEHFDAQDAFWEGCDLGKSTAECDAEEERARTSAIALRKAVGR